MEAPGIASISNTRAIRPARKGWASGNARRGEDGAHCARRGGVEVQASETGCFAPATNLVTLAKRLSNRTFARPKASRAKTVPAGESGVSRGSRVGDTFLLVCWRTNFAGVACAVVAAKQEFVLLNSMTNDGAPAMGARRCEELDGALKAVEIVGLAIHHDLEGFVVVITACFTLGHSHLRVLKPQNVPRTT